MKLREIVLLSSLTLGGCVSNPDMQNDYKEIRQVGDRLPERIGESIGYFGLWVKDKITGKKRIIGEIDIRSTQEDKGEGSEGEYQFLSKSCNMKEHLPPNAVLDVKNKILYVEYDLDQVIDETFFGYKTLRETALPMISPNCNSNRRAGSKGLQRALTQSR
ncbi:MAG: hypothetical protein WDZ77_01925 [Candidatus Pacearchaeota archaeon]